MSTTEQLATAVLTASEAAELERCELVIERGLETFYEVGAALLKIREGRLYRKQYTAFEDYCRERWGMSRQRAHQLIDASAVVSNLSTMVDIPSTERQAREVAAVEPELQKAVWQIAVETAPKNDEGDPMLTAGHIKSVASVVKEIVKSGGLDDGSGEVKPLGVLVDAAVTEETYERMMRQKERVKEYLDERTKFIEKMPWYRNGQRWVTGIDRHHYRDYLRIALESPWLVWLLFYHTEVAVNEHGDKSPTGLFGNDLITLQDHRDHESPNWGRYGMIYWAHKDLVALATCEDVETVHACAQRKAS